MLFNSFAFLWFLPTVLLAYFILRPQWRWILLLFASCVFYMYFIPKYILILFLIIIVDYVAGLAMQSQQGVRRKAVLMASIVANVGILVFFKYFNFLSDNIETFLNFLGWQGINLEKISWALPIGLSFHTFQSLSYTIEVYRGRTPAERHFGIYALYVMYFPQLVAGPIERPQNVIGQLKTTHSFEESRIISGLRLMAIGFLKKCVVADQCAIVVDKVFDFPGQYHGAMIVIATYLFAFQIFCDFSGYTDIARGVSRLFGVELMLNFDKPYFAKSIGEFWRRWHISLSTWFRDYLYIPLGGNRGSQWVKVRNILIVFLISGLWHGANWTFIAWGAIHGFYLACGMATTSWRHLLAARLGWNAVPSWLQDLLKVALTFNLVAIAWAFFRARSISDAFTLIQNAFDFGFDKGDVFASEITTAMALVVGLVTVQYLDEHWSVRRRFLFLPIFARRCGYFAALVALIYYSRDDAQSFIYFQF